jgi:hypothetical protein
MMKICIKISTSLLVFSFFLSCKSNAQEKAFDVYLAKMNLITNVVDSLVAEEDGLKCDSFTVKVNDLAKNLFKDDSLLHSVDIILREDNVFYPCGGGYAQFWAFPKGGAQCKCTSTKSARFDTKNFGTCFFVKEEGTIPPLQKNGVEYSYLLHLTLYSEKKFRNKYSPVVILEVFIPTGAVY